MIDLIRGLVDHVYVPSTSRQIEMANKQTKMLAFKSTGYMAGSQACSCNQGLSNLRPKLPMSQFRVAL